MDIFWYLSSSKKTNFLFLVDVKCGIKYYTGVSGTSGVIHMTNYTNYMSCDYKIDTGVPNTTISLMISRIDIEYSRGCLYDILSVCLKLLVLLI